MENVQTGDGRVWAPGAWEWDEAALAGAEIVFQWDREDDGGHLGAVEIGRLTSLARDGNQITVAGWVDDEWDDADEWVARCEAAGSMGVSAVWDDYEVEVIDTTLEPTEDETGAMVVLAAAGDPDPGPDAGLVVVEAAAGDVLERWVRSRFRMLTSVDMPAFVECRVSLDAAADEPAADAPVEEPADEAALLADGQPHHVMVVDGHEHIDGGSCACGGSCGSCGSGLIAGGAPAIPATPPRAWFDYDPALFAAYRSQAAADEFGTVRASADGEVYGYLAAWGVCHTGYHGECVTTPRTAAAYGHFRTGYVVCDDGSEVTTGPITMGGGHADLSLSYAGAIEHYDDVCAAVADVACGEDDFGVWFHGALRPDVTPEQVRALRASALSGDWRPVGSSLELVAALAVNAPGFPVPRARVASAGGRPRLMALVSAGAAGVAVMRANVAEQAAAGKGLEQRLEWLEGHVAAGARARLVAGARDRALARLRG